MTGQKILMKHGQKKYHLNPIEYKSNETEPYYPVNDSINNLKFLKYKKLSDNQSKYFFGGRLSEYKYYDMHQVIKSALSFVKNVIQLK